MRFCFLWAALLPLTIGLSPLAAQGRGPAQNRAPEPPRFRFMGPAAGGRISAVAGIPGDSLTLYFGSASGGVWKSLDGGQTNTPIFDSQPVQAIGALAVAPSDPRIVWAGTGEAWAIRDADVMGDGIYKSTDAGATWTNMGLKETGRIGRILINPSNPDIVFACALGRATGPQDERGVYRSTDGGKNWERVLFVDQNTGCSGLTMDAHDPNVLFAGMWEVVLHTWAMFSGGPGSSVHVSRDGGTTWTRLTDPGLPKSPVGKIDVAIAPSDSKRVYALIQTPNQGSLWRSDDGGATWKVASWDRSLIGRAGYYIRIEVNPANANEVLIANSSFHRSLDGGLTFPIGSPGGGGGGGGCGDCHDIWMDPKNPNRWAVTGDGGAGVTLNHGRSFLNVTIPNGQMYHVALDNRVPYWMYSNRQDNGTMRGPSTVPETSPNRAPTPVRPAFRPDSTRRDSIVFAAPMRPDSTRRAAADSAGAGGGGGGGEGGGFGGGGGSTWDHGIGGCESGFTIPDPTDYHIVWATCYGNKVTRYDDRTDRARSVSPWMHTLDSPPDAVKYRCHWTAPLAIDPFDHNAVYYGCQVIFKTVNGGQSWAVISPDLSTRDTSRIVSSGGIVGDNLGQFYGEVVFAIAPSEVMRGLLWAGTNDGKLWNTRDGGKLWHDVTANISGMPPWGTIRKIEPSHFDPGTAYVAVDFHMMDNRLPYIYKTDDYGRTWLKISDGLPATHPLDYVMAVAENPNRKGMLFAGTGHGFFYTLDDGRHWTQFKDGLPAAPVSWIVVPRLWHDVVVSTYGRGLFLLRDITMLEQQDKIAANTDLALYTPRPAYREARSGSVDFNYTLKAAPKDSVKLELLDTAGAVLRTLRAAGRTGLNRVSWDLRYDGPKQVELRTTPPDNPRIWDEPRYKGKTIRAISHWGIQAPQRAGPLVLPGRYQVRVTAGDKTETRPVSVLRDPAIPTSDLEMAVSTRAQLRIRDDINATAELVNRIEVLRKQIEDQLKVAVGTDGAAEALKALDEKLLAVELQLVSRTELHSDDKWFVEPYKVYLNLVWLSGEVGSGAGDVAGGAEFRPTDAETTTLAEQEKQLAAAKAAFDVLLKSTIPAFNRAMSGKLPAIAEKQGALIP